MLKLLDQFDIEIDKTVRNLNERIELTRREISLFEIQRPITSDLKDLHNQVNGLRLHLNLILRNVEESTKGIIQT